MNSREQVEQKLRERGLDGYLAAAGGFAKNAIRIEPEEQADDGIAIGASKLGGCPDLPRGAEWFRTEDTDVPMSFVCQVNFAEVKAHDREGRLPEKGILYLFYDCSMDGMKWGFDPADASGRKIYYYDGDEGALERKRPPEDLDENGVLFGAARMRFDSDWELPRPDSDLIDINDLSEDEADALWEMIEEEEDEPKYKLLGHSDNIQHGMEQECEFVTNGLYCGDGTGYEQGHSLGLDKNVGRWNLLMQIDSDEGMSMEWGDCGRIYLWATEEDLAARKFENAWLILQCS